MTELEAERQREKRHSTKKFLMGGLMAVLVAGGAYILLTSTSSEPDELAATEISAPEFATPSAPLPNALPPVPLPDATPMPQTSTPDTPSPDTTPAIPNP